MALTKIPSTLIDTTAGLSLSGDITLVDNDKAIFGTGSDLQIYHDSQDTYFINDTGQLKIRNRSDDKDIVLESDDGSGGTTSYVLVDGSQGVVRLYSYGSEKLSTTSTGIDVTGNIVVSGTVDGRDIATDGTKLDTIETNATADQTQSEINALGITATGLSGTPNITVGTISSGAITSSGNLIAGNSSNIAMDSSGNGQVEILGSGYGGAIALDGSAMHLYHNSSLRGLVLGTNETARLTIGGTGGFNFHSNNLTSIGTISSGAITSTGAIQGASFSDGTISGITFIDEDSFATNSATRVPTQQSVKSYVDAQVAGVVDSAPATLDTLNELAAALGDDANFSTTTSTALGNRLRVDTAAQGLTGTQQANAITNLGITATKAELNYVDGVTSNIQTQLNAKLASSSYTAADVLTKIKTVDGAGSGLDADLLDGISSASFLRSDADDTYTGNLTVTGNINQTGALTATSKSFDIEHPTKEGMRLHHGVLEGPEHAVYIRGKSNSYIIELPDYWEGLVHEDTITVQLTPIGGQNDMWIETIEDNKVYINCEREMKQYFYFIQAERKDVERFEVEYGNSV